MLFHRYLLLRYPAFILSLTVFLWDGVLATAAPAVPVCAVCVFLPPPHTPIVRLMQPHAPRSFLYRLIGLLSCMHLLYNCGHGGIIIYA